MQLAPRNHKIHDFFRRSEKVHKILFLPHVDFPDESPSKTRKWLNLLFRIALRVYMAFFAMVLSLYCCYFIVDFGKTSSFASSLNAYLVFSDLGFMMNCWPVFFTMNETFLKIFKDLSDIQKEMEEIGTFRLNLSSSRTLSMISYWFVMIMSATMGIRVIYLMRRGDQVELFLTLAFMYVEWLQTVIFVKLAVIVNILEKVFDLFNRNIDYLGVHKSEKGETLRKLKLIRMNHFKATQVVENVNGIFSKPIISLLSYYQFSLLNCFYDSFTRPLQFEAIFQIIMTFVFMIKVVLISYLTHRCQHEAMDNAKMALGKVAINSKCEQLRSEVGAFGLQLFHEDCTIRAGFFSLGGPFLFTYFGNVVTWVIMLIQLNKELLSSLN